VHLSATLLGSGTCLAALANTTSGYDPPVASVPAPCVVTQTHDLPIPLFGVTLTLHDASLAARYTDASGQPCSAMGSNCTLHGGLIRGFLSADDALNTLVSVPPVANTTILSLFTGSCAPSGQADTDPGGGVWVYVNFTGVPVSLAETLE
jgi:hypothetical protein